MHNGRTMVIQKSGQYIMLAVAIQRVVARRVHVNSRAAVMLAMCTAVI
jgi:hypothetical protein